MDKFTQFLNTLKTPSNISLIESIKEGYFLLESKKVDKSFALCNRCAQAIKSKGELIQKVPNGEIDFNDDDVANCDWCGEEFERGEIKEYK